MSLRQRSALFLVVVLGLLAGSIVAIALKPTVLGLDLQGGVQVVLQGKPTPDAQVTDEAINRSIDIIRNRVDRFGVSEPEIQKEGSDRINVALPGAEDPEVVVDLVKPAQLFFYDFERNFVARRGDLYALATAAERRDPIPGGRDPSLYLFQKAAPHRLLAGPEVNRRALLERFDGKVPPGAEIVTVPRGYVIFEQTSRVERSGGLPPLEQTEYVLLRNEPALVGDDVKGASQSFDQARGNAPIVVIDFTDEGDRKFRDVTRELARRGERENALQSFAAVLDGEIITTPTVDYREYPTGIDPRNGVQIEGNFSVDEARTLADQINSGALPIGLDVISQKEVSATLGKQSLRQGVIAAAVGLVLVVAFLLAYYRLLGLIAAFALVAYGVLLIAVVKLIPITLTLPGIAGVILTIGVASDANVVVFERAREEARAGKAGFAAVIGGYRKSLSAILDANLVTLLTAVILFLFSTAGVKGFAFALFIGVLLSLFTAYLATRALFGVVGDSRPFRNPRLTGINMREPQWKFDIVGKWRLWLAISFVPMALGAAVIGVRGLNLGLEFESGTRIVTAFERQPSENQVRDVLRGLGYGDAKIQATTERVGNREVRGFQIQTESLQPAERNRVVDALDDRLGIDRETLQLETVGPTFGEEIIRKAIIAIVLSFLLITVYLAVRFEMKLAVPALISVVHDVWLTLAIYSLVGREITSATVAAILTILGYSLYDVVIVFDRIRENVPLMPRATYRQIVNRSVHETLNRSLITSFLTLLPVVVLLLFGGDTLKDFAFALTIGLLSGGVSSIAIAAPIAALWKEREPEGRRRQARERRRLAALDADIVDVEALARAEAALEATAAREFAGPSGGARGQDGPTPEEVDEEPRAAGPEPDEGDVLAAELSPPPAPPEEGGPAPVPEAGPGPAAAERPARERRHQKVQRRRRR